MKPRNALGTILTIPLIGFAALLLWRQRDSLQYVSLSEWGDFLAGISAPLALLWLVLGYLQQGEELRLNTMALQLQQEELRKQVEETAALVRQTERQAEASAELAALTRAQYDDERLAIRQRAQPDLDFAGGQASGDSTTMTFTNRGGRAENLLVTCDQECKVWIEPSDRLRPGKSGSLRTEGVLQWPVKFTFHYTDALGVEQDLTIISKSPGSAIASERSN